MTVQEKNISIRTDDHKRCTYCTVASILGKRTLKVSDFVPVHMAQAAMTLLETLWQLFRGDPRQGRQSENLEHDLSDLQRLRRGCCFRLLTNQRIARLKQLRVAPTGDVLERHERSRKGAVGFEVSSKVLL